MEEKLFLGLAWMAVGILEDILTITSRFDLSGVAVIHMAMLMILMLLVKRDND